MGNLKGLRDEQLKFKMIRMEIDDKPLRGTPIGCEKVSVLGDRLENRVYSLLMLKVEKLIPSNI